MATIKVKNSVSSGSDPTGLTFGELAVNITDKKIYIGNAVGSTITLHDQNGLVTSVNGATGAITNVAKTDTAQTFTQLQEFSAGISASASTNTLEVTSSTLHSAGIRVANGHSGTAIRYGAIALGRSTTASHNTFIYNNSGTFQILNGIDYTSTKLLELDISGADILNNSGLLTISKSSYLGNDSAVVRIVGADVGATNYNSDIIANISASSNTVHTLPELTGTLLNRNTIAAGSNIEFSVSGATLTISSTASGGGAGFTYTTDAPSSPSVGDRWIDSDTGIEYVYIYDGSSYQWIEPISSNLISGITYTASTNTMEFGVTAEFDGPVTSDGGFRITSNAINAQTGTSYSLNSSDNGKIITCSNASPITVTVPSGLPVGFNTTIIQIGAGQVGVTSSGTTINSFESKYNLAGQHSAASIISYTTNVFNLAGGADRMMIPSFKHGIIASSRPRIVTSSVDLTPNAVNWNNLTYNATTDVCDINEELFSGFDEVITIKIELSNPSLFAGNGFYYRAGSGPYWGDITTYGSTIITIASFGQGTVITNPSSSFTFSVSPNQYLALAGFGNSSDGSCTVTVKNQSDGDAVLDTFTITVIGAI